MAGNLGLGNYKRLSNVTQVRVQLVLLNMAGNLGLGNYLGWSNVT